MKTQISILTLLITSTSTYAINIGKDENDVTLNVNTDNGKIGSFIVYNGTGNSQNKTFESNRNFTNIMTSNGNKFSLDDTGAHLSNITLDGIKGGWRMVQLMLLTDHNCLK